MFRNHFMSHWFGLSDLAAKEALFASPMYREFAQLEDRNTRLLDVTFE
jgi:IS5 family transposase